MIGGPRFCVRARRSNVFMAVRVGLFAGSVGDGGDLDRVVAEDAPAAPGSCAFETA